jgi:ElaB/YqjD/DUF883 family membrane-anchored ribosome-binding protein
MNEEHNQQEQRHVWSSIPVGAGFGVALGLVLMNILDRPGFFPVGIGVGLCLGMVIGLAMDQRKGE